MRKTAVVLLVLFIPALLHAADKTNANNPKAVIQTTAGDFNCTLYQDKAPVTVENFIALAEGTKDWKNPVSKATKHNTPLYDGTIFHRVIPQFMIQGGDPAGNGTGGPGYEFKDEFDSSLKFDKGGVLAMANSGRDTNGSQFFITEVPTPHLNGRHTIFGQCQPVSLVERIARMPSDPNTNRPFNPVRITHIKIIRPGDTGKAAEKPADTKKH